MKNLVCRSTDFAFVSNSNRFISLWMCVYHSVLMWCKCCVFLSFALILSCWCWNSSCLITAYMEISLLNSSVYWFVACVVYTVYVWVLLMEVYYTQPIHELHLLMNAILLDFKIIIILIELWSTTFNTISALCAEILFSIVNEKFSGR